MVKKKSTANELTPLELENRNFMISEKNKELVKTIIEIRKENADLQVRCNSMARENQRITEDYFKIRRAINVIGPASKKCLNKINEISEEFFTIIHTCSEFATAPIIPGTKSVENAIVRIPRVTVNPPRVDEGNNSCSHTPSETPPENNNKGLSPNNSGSDAFSSPNSTCPMEKDDSNIVNKSDSSINKSDSSINKSDRSKELSELDEDESEPESEKYRGRRLSDIEEESERESLSRNSIPVKDLRVNLTRASFNNSDLEISNVAVTQSFIDQSLLNDISVSYLSQKMSRLENETTTNQPNLSKEPAKDSSKNSTKDYSQDSTKDSSQNSTKDSSNLNDSGVTPLINLRDAKVSDRRKNITPRNFSNSLNQSTNESPSQSNSQSPNQCDRESINESNIQSPNQSNRKINENDSSFEPLKKRPKRICRKLDGSTYSLTEEDINESLSEVYSQLRDENFLPLRKKTRTMAVQMEESDKSSTIRKTEKNNSANSYSKDESAQESCANRSLEDVSLALPKVAVRPKRNPTLRRSPENDNERIIENLSVLEGLGLTEEQSSMITSTPMMVKSPNTRGSKKSLLSKRVTNRRTIDKVVKSPKVVLRKLSRELIESFTSADNELVNFIKPVGNPDDEESNIENENSNKKENKIKSKKTGSKKKVPVIQSNSKVKSADESMVKCTTPKKLLESGRPKRAARPGSLKERSINVKLRRSR